jgi:hypothetical protein
MEQSDKDRLLHTREVLEDELGEKGRELHMHGHKVEAISDLIEEKYRQTLWAVEREGFDLDDAIEAFRNMIKMVLNPEDKEKESDILL